MMPRRMIWSSSTLSNPFSMYVHHAKLYSMYIIYIHSDHLFNKIFCTEIHKSKDGSECLLPTKNVFFYQ